MKYVSLFLLLIISLQVKSQIFDLSRNLFSEEGFFYPDEIRKQKIKSILISKSEKKDGEFFEKEIPELSYTFYDNGFLKEALKFTAHAKRIDTSRFSYYYNSNSNIFKRVEQQGPFLFYYYYMYADNMIEKEIKIDGRSPVSDTAYIRLYENSFENNKLTTTVLNSIQKPFKIIITRKDLFDQVTLQRTEYTRTANFSETIYNYQLNQLNSKKHQSYFGKVKDVEWTYQYKNGMIDLITVTENGTPTFKYGFTYDKDKKVKAIVERNRVEKTVSIYKFTYKY